MSADAARAAHPLLDAAARLAQALVGARDEETRLALLKRVARRLEQQGGYPTFLKLLKTIAESHDVVARRAVADTLAIALRRNDLPGGLLTSWGGSRLWPAGAANEGVLAGQFFGSAPRRSFGPIEYLTAWLCQGTQRTRLGETAYADALARLIDLVNVNDEARQHYPRKIESDTQTGLEGVYTQATRVCLANVAARWSAGEAPADIAAAALADRAAAGAPALPRGWLVRDL